MRSAFNSTRIAARLVFAPVVPAVLLVAIPCAVQALVSLLWKPRTHEWLD